MYEKVGRLADMVRQSIRVYTWAFGSAPHAHVTGASEVTSPMPLRRLVMSFSSIRRRLHLLEALIPARSPAQEPAHEPAPNHAHRATYNLAHLLAHSSTHHPTALPTMFVKAACAGDNYCIPYKLRPADAPARGSRARESACDGGGMSWGRRDIKPIAGPIVSEGAHAALRVPARRRLGATAAGRRLRIQRRADRRPDGAGRGRRRARPRLSRALPHGLHLRRSLPPIRAPRCGARRLVARRSCHGFGVFGPRGRWLAPAARRAAFQLRGGA